MSIQKEIQLDVITTSLGTTRETIVDSQPFNFDFISEEAVEIVYNSLNEIKQVLEPTTDEFRNYIRINIETHKQLDMNLFGWIRETTEMLIGKKYEYQLFDKLIYKQEFINHLLVILFELSNANISWTISKRK